MSHGIGTSAGNQPLLLVSVRDAAEARAAIAGGCDVLDVKEPSRGALGMADVDSITQIVQFAHGAEFGGAPPLVSAALGEVTDWTGGDVPRLPSELEYVKLAFAGLGKDASWFSRWQRVRHQFERASGRPPDWIAVVYADWEAAGAPQPTVIIEAAVEAGCAGVLIDTYTKDGGTLVDWMTEELLLEYSQRVRDDGLLLALAGGLRAELVPVLAHVRPDVLAIRTAACRDGRRDGRISTSAVRKFKLAMTSVFILE